MWPDVVTDQQGTVALDAPTHPADEQVSQKDLQPQILPPLGAVEFVPRRSMLCHSYKEGRCTSLHSGPKSREETPKKDGRCSHTGGQHHHPMIHKARNPDAPIVHQGSCKPLQVSNNQSVSGVHIRRSPGEEWIGTEASSRLRCAKCWHFMVHESETPAHGRGFAGISLTGVHSTF